MRSVHRHWCCSTNCVYMHDCIPFMGLIMVLIIFREWCLHKHREIQYMAIHISVTYTVYSICIHVLLKICMPADSTTVSPNCILSKSLETGLGTKPGLNNQDLVFKMNVKL